MENIFALKPEISIIIMSLLNILIGSFKVSHFQIITRYLSIISLIIGIYLIFGSFGTNGFRVFNNMLTIDKFSNLTKIVMMAVTGFVLIIHSGVSRELLKLARFEFSVIVSLALIGLMVAVSANSFLVLYMGLELFSLAAYVLTAFNRNDINSSEAGLKYFILGSVSSAIFLFGASLIYGFTGTISLSSLSEIFINSSIVPIAVLIGIVMVMISLFFKLSAAPFHMWTPDVYQGAPTLVTLFLSTVPKMALISIVARLYTQVFIHNIWDLQQILSVVSIISMIVGSIGALRQKNMKRLLAYSSIGHIGFALMGITIADIDSINASMIYVIIYSISSIGAFAVILCNNAEGSFLEILDDFKGLAKKNIYLAIAMLIVLMSMMGIPPLAGFFAKFYLFQSAISHNFYLLLIASVIYTLVSSYYYLIIIKKMFFDETQNNSLIRVNNEIKFTLGLMIISILFFFYYFNFIAQSNFISSFTMFMDKI